MLPGIEIEANCKKLHLLKKNPGERNTRQVSTVKSYRMARAGRGGVQFQTSARTFLFPIAQ